MNQSSVIPFGSDISKFAGYVQTVNERLGAIDLIVQNTGTSTLTLTLKSQATAASGWSNIPGQVLFTVVPGGQTTRSLKINSKRIGLFGSGNTTANISYVLANKGDLRGAQIDITAVGRRGWDYDSGFDKTTQNAGYTNQPDTGETPLN